MQKGVLESLFVFPLKVLRRFHSKPYWGREETDSPKTLFWTTVSPHDAFSAPLARADVCGCEIGPPNRTHNIAEGVLWRSRG